MQIKLSRKTYSIFECTFLLTLFIAAMATPAGSQNQPSAIPELARSYEQMQHANQALHEAQQRGSRQDIDRAQAHMVEAQNHMQQSLSVIAGIPVQDIQSMVQANLGWVQICEELGIQPSLLGVHTTSQSHSMHQGNIQSAREVSQATGRQMSATSPPVHGITAFSSHGAGHGLGSAASHSGQSGRGFMGVNHNSDSRGGTSSSGKGGHSGQGDHGGGWGGSGQGGHGGGGGDGGSGGGGSGGGGGGGGGCP